MALAILARRGEGRVAHGAGPPAAGAQQLRPHEAQREDELVAPAQAVEEPAAVRMQGFVLYNGGAPFITVSYTMVYHLVVRYI